MKDKKTEENKKQKNNEAELKETVQRLQAEFENYKKRVEKEKENFTKFASCEIIKKILPILDSFEVALKNKTASSEFAKGVEMIYAQFFSILENSGLKKIEAEGKKFDPYLHEALMQEESEEDDGVVIEEFQKGYYLNDIIIRHSKVKISKRATK